MLIGFNFFFIFYFDLIFFELGKSHLLESHPEIWYTFYSRLNKHQKISKNWKKFTLKLSQNIWKKQTNHTSENNLKMIGELLYFFISYLFTLTWPNLQKNCCPFQFTLKCLLLLISLFWISWRKKEWNIFLKIIEIKEEIF